MEKILIDGSEFSFEDGIQAFQNFRIAFHNRSSIVILYQGACFGTESLAPADKRFYIKPGC
jgi:hypothetical protein